MSLHDFYDFKDQPRQHISGSWCVGLWVLGLLLNGLVLTRAGSRPVVAGLGSGSTGRRCLAGRLAAADLVAAAAALADRSAAVGRGALACLLAVAGERGAPRCIVW